MYIDNLQKSIEKHTETKFLIYRNSHVSLGFGIHEN